MLWHGIGMRACVRVRVCVCEEGQGESLINMKENAKGNNYYTNFLLL